MKGHKHPEEGTTYFVIGFHLSSNVKRLSTHDFVIKLY